MRRVYASIRRRPDDGGLPPKAPAARLMAVRLVENGASGPGPTIALAGDRLTGLPNPPRPQSFRFTPFRVLCWWVGSGTSEEANDVHS